MFTTNDFVRGEKYTITDTNGKRIFGRVTRIDHHANIIEFHATVGENTGRYAIRCCYIETMAQM